MLNPRKKSGWMTCIALISVSQCSGLLHADEGSITAPSPVVGSAQIGAVNPLGNAAVSEQALAQQRGGTLVVNDMNLNGVVTDNQAYNLNTGSNTISDGAFSGANGIPMVIQNSGNNVLIQNATIVNVQVQ